MNKIAALVIVGDKIRFNGKTAEVVGTERRTSNVGAFTNLMLRYADGGGELASILSTNKVEVA